MYKLIYRVISAIVLLALTFGSYTNIGASAASVAASGNNYFMSLGGNDNNSGSISQSWRTIQKAAAISLPAFPGAQGFGSQTVGGRGGQVIKVTNLNDSGSGSLRNALTASGPRIVVFDIGGTINLSSTIKITNPYLTIAGQTAPGDGILIRGPYAPGSVNGGPTSIEINTHDVVIRGLRIREVNRAAIALYANPSGGIYNIIVDHNSLSWSTDSIVDMWYNPHGVTFSWNIISEPVGSHNYGMLIGGYDDCTTPGYNISIHHNLFSQNSDRTPRINQKIGSPEFVNNVVYNWNWYGTRTTASAAIIGNHYIAGKNTVSSRPVYVQEDTKCSSLQPASVYVSHNIGQGRTTDTGDDWNIVDGGTSKYRTDSPPFALSGITQDAVMDVKAKVLAGAGAIIPRRDSVDVRVVNDAKNGTGSYLVSSPNEVGGWPTLNSGTASQDSDNDGMPDAWEQARGGNLSPTGVSPSGYTWVEEYINSLISGGSGSSIPTATPTVSSSPTQTPAWTNTPLPATATPLPANGPSVSTIINPASINPGGVSTVNVNLNNIQVGGYTSAEFTCTYNPALLEANTIAVANQFGTDPLVAINGPQNGSFILAVAGSKGSRATVNGTTFTFNAKGLQTGQAVIECKARVSKGDNILVDIPSTGGANLTIGSAPTVTPTPAIQNTVSVPTTTTMPQPTFTPTQLPATPTLTMPTAASTSTSTPLPANGPSVSTIIIPTSINVGEVAKVNVNLNNILVGGYTSAEFTCTYNPALLEANTIAMANLFGADPLAAINGPQNGSFILAVAGSNGNRATVNGTAFTFNAKGLQAGQAVIECKARVSKGDNILVDIPSTGGANLTIGSAPTVTPTPAIQNTVSAPTKTPTTLPFTPTASPSPVITGKVLASKPVTIRLYKADNSLATTLNANPDGTFNFTAPAGTYTITATASGFLSAQGSITLTNGNTRTMSIVTLPAGDIDGNGVIDQFDVLTIGMSYNSANPPAADLNNDGTINVLDMELPAVNYRKAGAVAWQ